MPTLASVNTWWYAFWYTAEPPSFDESSIHAYSGHQLDSRHLRYLYQPGCGSGDLGP